MVIQVVALELHVEKPTSRGETQCYRRSADHSLEDEEPPQDDTETYLSDINYQE